MQINSGELSEYIKSTLDAIHAGISNSKGFRNEGDIEFDLAVVNSGESGGSINVHIAKTGGKEKTEEISRIRFKVTRDYDKDPDNRPVTEFIPPENPAL